MAQDAEALAGNLTGIDKGFDMSMAQSHFAAGCFHLAEKMARDALRENRENRDGIDAVGLLGAIAYRAGRTDDAIALMARAANAMPQIAPYHANLCEMFRATGRLEEAVQAGARAVLADPKLALAHVNLAVAYIAGADFKRGETSARRGCDLDPAMAEAFNALGNALRGQKRRDEAEDAYRHAMTLKPDYYDAVSNCGVMLRDRRNYAAAEPLLRNALRMRPASVDAHLQLALNCQNHDKSDEALKILTQAGALEPTRADAFFAIARILAERGKTEGAISACRQALKAKPDHPTVLNLLGRLLRETDDMAQAIAFCRKALEQKPDAPDILNNLGIALLESGDLDGAAEALTRAVAIEPGSVATYINLASARKFKAGDPEIAAMEQALADPKSDPRNAIGLRYATGKVMDDIGEHERAFALYAEGAAMKRKTINYNGPAMARLFDRIKHVFTPELLAEKSGLGSTTERPVFIVGMPRSGSTLIEQILASHSQVQALGEVKTLHNAVLALDEGFAASMRYPELMHLFDKSQLETVRRNFESHLPPRDEGKSVYTDKMLTNYFYVGLIYLLYPNARVIYSRRNAVDTCLSCYSKLFKEEMAYTYDLKELAQYYRKCSELMEHWMKVLPEGFILAVDYEDVVGDIETSARRITAHCNLDWEPACLDFHKNERVVKTASVAQVRRPLYQTSVARWKRYGAAIDPLVTALGDRA
ncbi:MAG: sulfotransferase [Parvibaculaceae bacterium]